MRICLAYDCLFPYTVGGAERWYRSLAEHLARDGHEVTYLTRQLWREGEEPDLDGVEVIPVAPGGPLYDDAGRRTVGEPVRFGLGVLAHLVRNRRRYDAVHTCAFPYFSVPAIRMGLAGRRVPVGVDWFEVWSVPYWREYLGPVRGRIGHAVQRVCVRLTSAAFAFSGVHERRLLEEGLRTAPVRLSGLYDGPTEPRAAAGAEREPLVVFAGRHIPEKRVTLIPAVVERVRRRVPGARGIILGDGPERDAVLEQIRARGVEDAVSAPGFVDSREVADALGSAACLLLPSVREGYGMVVIEAAAAGTPSVVADAPDNAASELVEPGVNGYVAAAADVEPLADAVVRVLEEGAELRASTVAWFEREAERLHVRHSVEQIAAHYSRPATRS